MANGLPLKLLPSGIFYPHVKNIIGTGVVIDPMALDAEAELLQPIIPEAEIINRLLISEKAHLVLPTYKYWISTSRNPHDIALSERLKMVLAPPIPIKHSGRMYGWEISFPKILKPMFCKF
ncbi:hypothetical protein BWD42_22050 [Sphingobacterium sp. CZ-UAM]|nr:hypothetical protein BWD42_22050 [Sphingobacterium sp. CZ-UAM]